MAARDRGDEVVAGSQYADGGKRTISSGCPDEVIAFAQKVLGDIGWRPDPLFMLDVCESEGTYYVVELNSFSCSWLYACDFARVVEVASDRAIWWTPLSRPKNRRP
ncbi:ATP-grasp domain-containing protein [Fimbriiglobus ruber]|uniref:ATP-grasp domain-containing protein n=1 Tax=Fimbriiglobus ruber TaxID=1908690 RepID=A0A225DKD4_9BACT|nr:ATP-grasp domain-containing protein [Fimbriiglobus ruber]OWK41832.1 hypothetical protein FRUB_03910 [Fimbriiglobus ruber]